MGGGALKRGESGDRSVEVQGEEGQFILQVAEKYGKTPNPMPITEHVGDTLLRLPIYYEITEDEMKRVVDGIHEFYAAHPSSEPYFSANMKG